MKKITPDTYRDLKIVKTTIRVAGRKMPQLVTLLKCEVAGQVLESPSWRDLELQIDERLDQTKSAARPPKPAP